MGCGNFLWHESKAGEDIGTYQQSGGVAASKHFRQPHICDLCCDAILIQQYIACLDVKHDDLHQATNDLSETFRPSPQKNWQRLMHFQLSGSQRHLEQWANDRPLIPLRCQS